MRITEQFEILDNKMKAKPTHMIDRLDRLDMIDMT